MGTIPFIYLSNLYCNQLASKICIHEYMEHAVENIYQLQFISQMSYQCPLYDISHILSVRCHISIYSMITVTLYQLDVISVSILRYQSRFISQMSYQCSFYDISNILLVGCYIYQCSFYVIIHDLSVRCHISDHFTVLVTIYQLDVKSVFILQYKSHVTFYQLDAISVFILRYQS